MSKYGPAIWPSRAQGAYHVDAGDNLPSGVTLSSVDSWTLERVTGLNPEERTDYTANVTVANETIVTGEDSQKADSGIDFTIVVATSTPPYGDGYRLTFVCTRSDGYTEVVELAMKIKP